MSLIVKILLLNETLVMYKKPCIGDKTQNNLAINVHEMNNFSYSENSQKSPFYFINFELNFR